MDPEERADYFTKVDRLEPEKIPESQQLESFQIPTSLHEIFEISNANKRFNKQRKKQQANSVNSAQAPQNFMQICTHQYQ
jgi:hypothetical protein